MNLLCESSSTSLSMRHEEDDENTKWNPLQFEKSLFPWLLVRNAISFPNHHLLLSAGSTEDEKTYSAQVEPQKMASDREVLSSKPFNRAHDFCSLHGTPAWNDRNPQ